MLTFEPGRKYSRADVKEIAGLRRTAKGGLWDTGIVEQEGEFVIFANVGAEGRTGHNYDNRWEGENFQWFHKGGSHLGWPSVKRLLADDSVVHLFWRDSNRTDFEYAGQAKPVEYLDTSPVAVLWGFTESEVNADMFEGPDEIPSKEFNEGKANQVLVNRYERDPAARRACIDYFGSSCVVCGFSFEERYGPIGKGYIHVHHLVPLSEVGENYKVDPVNDLRPICPNCHAMAHRRRPPYTIEDLHTFIGTRMALPDSLQP